MPIFLNTITLLLLTGVYILSSVQVVVAEWEIDKNYLEYMVDISELGKAAKIALGKSRKVGDKKVYEIQKERGVVQTGLTPLFDSNVTCRPIDSEFWAKDYSHKRGKPAHHKGVDIPAPKGTAILAVADGVVVGKFLNENNPKGIEIVLRHEPKDTGIPLWTYSQYTHLQEMPDIPIGATVKIGTQIGKTSNTGISGQEARRRNKGRTKFKYGADKVRRDALHYAIFYSLSPNFVANKKRVIPIDGYYMDPNAFYREDGPYDSSSMKKLAENEKNIPIPYMTEDGQFVPNDTKVIWPYSCVSN